MDVLIIVGALVIVGVVLFVKSNRKVAKKPPTVSLDTSHVPTGGSSTDDSKITPDTSI
jgi:hypothetical protein